MPTLGWMGKSKVVAYHRQVPYRVLERIPEKSVLDSHGSDCGNMVIHGDNLEALKALLPEYEGKVDCIYIDPPYNTGNEGLQPVNLIACFRLFSYDILESCVSGNGRGVRASTSRRYGSGAVRTACPSHLSA